ncbi:hypothetical protein M5K25_021259 [Dendrobium thyrsiflorum]|uniref:Uncharacterized protein n=1 Tax=Dendrobium thyrsiflorum TaxID=117978 RepID=A0ABD0UC01_DENTH
MVVTDDGGVLRVDNGDRRRLVVDASDERVTASNSRRRWEVVGGDSGAQPWRATVVAGDFFFRLFSFSILPQHTCISSGIRASGSVVMAESSKRLTGDDDRSLEALWIAHARFHNEGINLQKTARFGIPTTERLFCADTERNQERDRRSPLPPCSSSTTTDVLPNHRRSTTQRPDVLPDQHLKARRSAEPPPEARRFAGPPPEARRSAGPPPEARRFAGPPPEARRSAGHTLDARRSAGHPPDTRHSTGHTPDSRRSTELPLDVRVLPDYQLTPELPSDVGVLSDYQVTPDLTLDYNQTVDICNLIALKDESAHCTLFKF